MTETMSDWALNSLTHPHGIKSWATVRYGYNGMRSYYFECCYLFIYLFIIKIYILIHRHHYHRYYDDNDDDAHQTSA